MDTRRDFIKKAALLSGGAGLVGLLPESVAKAIAINPAMGSTYMDAEHIVILMQENRSFDHCFGTLQGVRGFNDPRAIVKPDENLVWLQKNAAGETYAPFRLNIKDTNATWLGSLPHSWTNQVDARNGGKYDKWLIAKPSGHEGFAKVPLTMGYYNREDLPFYYSLADAFTVCDQNFCSCLTGTTPNRLYLWTGTVRPEQHTNSFAHLRNEDADYPAPVSWTTFPERLEANNISWKIYQNEISLPSGLNEDEDAWLSNFTDNPIEFFSQYNIKHAASYRNFIKTLPGILPPKMDALKEKIKSVPPGTDDYKKMQEQLKEMENWLRIAGEDINKYTEDAYEKLTAHQKSLHEKAFCINKNDPHYRSVETLQYTDDTTQREMLVPKGDVLHQFRQDADNDKLPAVSWIVGPENFSDHPGAPWYGAWYVSEVMDILTKRPELWKKTIFILCYDENDGYFDHLPPFVAPNPQDKSTGFVSASIDASTEFVTLEQDMTKYEQKHARESSIGLGYRVPLIIASPWSRGGAVCSQVFDHTSIIQFVEKFLSEKFNKKIEEPNISPWRRAVCGDLTSVFKPYNGEAIAKPDVVAKNAFIETVHKAKFKKDPSGYKILSATEIENINKRNNADGIMPVQEKGVRPSCALPYELYADGRLNADNKTFNIKFTAGTAMFGAKSSGSPFYVYAGTGNELKVKAYAVAAGDSITDSWTIDDFSNKQYQLNLHGPNGFFRMFKGNASDPAVDITVKYNRYKMEKKIAGGNIEIVAACNADKLCAIEITDNAYKSGHHTMQLDGRSKTKKQASLVLDLSKSFGWYDFTVRVKGHQAFEKRYAGHVETGKSSFTDPFMGGVV